MTAHDTERCPACNSDHPLANGSWAVPCNDPWHTTPPSVPPEPRIEMMKAPLPAGVEDTPEVRERLAAWVKGVPPSPERAISPEPPRLFSCTNCGSEHRLDENCPSPGGEPDASEIKADAEINEIMGKYMADLDAAMEENADLRRQLADTKEELQSRLNDWNDLVKASGSPTNGGAIGYVAQTKRQLQEAQDRIHRLLLLEGRDETT